LNWDPIRVKRSKARIRKKKTPGEWVHGAAREKGANKKEKKDLK